MLCVILSPDTTAQFVWIFSDGLNISPPCFLNEIPNGATE
ncbi:hypothetical protein NEIFL0001_1858 [Neisseria flavescens SK114]|nr:hypothetical protein NEIFL0001_1858 [Neisseria flavescens SK114]